MYTKYGGYSLTKEPHRPSDKIPQVDDAKFLTVNDVKDRIIELKQWLLDPAFETAKDFIKEEISKMEDLIASALTNKKEK